ncbi:CBU_0592 family membrane protein [Neptuniibacter sp. QD37_11]|uniref:CBU_0592 family membrane protein n=1 Tax=Neptuniibacter sp. QD37_11 TaxID=3398209 RepID=UPI0039F4AAA9
MSADLADILYNGIGLIGTALYIISYTLLQLGKLDGNGRAYILYNLGGAICVSISLIHNFNLASLTIQLFWIAISIVGLIKMQREKKGDPSPAEV